MRGRSLSQQFSAREFGIIAMTADSANLPPHPWENEIILLNACRSEFDRVTVELDELRLLLTQSTQEVETLNQRKVLAGVRVRDMEERLEQYSRKDIRDAYLESSEAEMRAFMLSEQRDQWQAKVRNHERYHSFLTQVLQALPHLGSPQRVAETRSSKPLPSPVLPPTERPLSPSASKAELAPTMLLPLGANMPDLPDLPSELE